MLASSSWLWLSSFELHTNRGLRSGNRAGNTNITTQRQGGSWVGQKLGTIRVANEHHWNVGTSDRWLEWRSILGVDDHDTNGTMCNSNIDLVLEGAVASTNNKVLHTHTRNQCISCQCLSCTLLPCNPRGWYIPCQQPQQQEWHWCIERNLATQWGWWCCWASWQERSRQSRHWSMS
jgi:hypothetical protein